MSIADAASPVPDARRAKRRRRLFAAAAVLLSSLVAFAIGEVVIRLVVGAPLPERRPLMLVEPHPTRAWAMPAGSDHYTYEHPVRVNELGLRGGAVGPKQPGEHRVLMLGDSLVYGQGVAERDTLPVRLEAALNGGAGASPAKRYRVINAGVRGYSTGQELALLDELGPRIAPDTVLLCWFWNDIKETEIADAYKLLKAAGTVPFDTLEPIEGWARVKWEVKQVLRRSALVMYTHDVVQSLRAPAPDERMIERGEARVVKQLKELRRKADQRGFDVRVVIIPDANTLFTDHVSAAIDDHVATAAADAGLPIVWLNEPLQKLYDATGELPVVPFDGHYNGQANAVMAEAIAEHVP